MEQLIEKAMAYAQELFEKEYSGHDYWHTLRVYKMAVQLAEKEGANLLNVSLAALLHDVDDIKLSPETHAEKGHAVAFLRENGVEESQIQTICHMIDQVSFKGSSTVVPDSIEGKCVQDADRLDAIGAMGVGRAFAFGGNHNRKMYDPQEAPCPNMDEAQYRNRKSTTINHFYEKLFLLKSMMNTQTAKEAAEKRDRLMHEFVEAFLTEWEGKL